MSSSALAKQIIYHREQVDEIIKHYGGFFVNKETCALENYFVVRVDPRFHNSVIFAISRLGFVVGSLNAIGIQLYIGLKGFIS